MYVRTSVRVRHASGMSISNALGMSRRARAHWLGARVIAADVAGGMEVGECA